jgi:hypothetical protein
MGPRSLCKEKPLAAANDRRTNACGGTLSYAAPAGNRISPSRLTQRRDAATLHG